MNDNEKLIEEAASAIWNAHETGLSRGYLAESRPHYSDSQIYARAALAVFEKAHTPTDDEREVLIDAEGWPVAEVVDVVMTRWSNVNDQIRRNVGGWMWRSLAASAIQSLAQVGLLRRTEVPEPSAEYAKVWDAAFFKGWLARHVARPDADGNFGPTLPLPNPYGKVQHSMACDACGALTFDSARFGAAHEAKADGRGCPGMFTTPRKDVEPIRHLRECTVCGEKVTMSNATEAWEKRHKHAEPQGEPSDAQVLGLVERAQGIVDSMKSSTGRRTRGDEWCYVRFGQVESLDGVLAALRAAGEVR